MALIKSVRGFTPKIGENCYLADNATIIGDVVIGKDCSIWFNAVLRGDVNAIRIGNRVNRLFCRFLTLHIRRLIRNRCVVARFRSSF